MRVGAVVRKGIRVSLSIAALSLPLAALAAEQRGRAVEFEGELSAVYEDGEGWSRLRLEVTERSGRRHALQAVGDVGALRDGAKVRVRGIELPPANGADDGALVVAACCSEAGISLTAPAPIENTLGEQRTLVLAANFQDDPSRPWTLEQIRSLVLGTVSDFYLENSYGRTWLAGDVYGWFTLPLSRSVCSLSTAGNAADQAALAAGIDLAAYDRIVYVFTNTACAVSGMATVGGNPSRAWIDGVLTQKNVAHELGHNLGLEHSHALDCGDAPIGGTCASIEYGDSLDTMGSDAGHFNAFQKQRLGWLGSAGAPALATVTADGSYSISAYETGDGAASALRIPRGVDPVSGRMTWYYAEYRQPLGFDAFLAGRSYLLWRGDVTHGVVIHLVEEGNANSSNLLHMNLDPAFRALYGDNDWFDPALPVGAEFVDGERGISIRAVSADGAEARVAVTLAAPGCVRAAPSLAIAPGEGPAVAAGSSMSYSVTVTNRDSADCAGTSLDLAASVPSGWNGVFDSARLELAPGASLSTALDVTSAASAAAGSYSLAVSARDAADASRSATATAIYRVSVADVNAAPIAIDDAAATDGTPVRIAVLANDSDPDGDTLSVRLATQGARGRVAINPDGSVTYTPLPRAKGSDSFSYTVTDGRLDASATVNVRLGRTGSGKGR